MLKLPCVLFNLQVGVFATRGGELSVVEYSELTPEQVPMQVLVSELELGELATLHPWPAKEV